MLSACASLVSRVFFKPRSASEESAATELAHAALLQSNSDSMYILSEDAMSRLVYGRKYSAFEPVFRWRPDESIKPESRTAFEWFQKLRNDGWVWRQWKAKSRSKRGPEFIEGYRPGDPKVLFTSGAVVSASYLRALHDAEVLSEHV
jgi:hypothetical protein